MSSKYRKAKWRNTSHDMSIYLLERIAIEEKKKKKNNYQHVYYVYSIRSQRYTKCDEQLLKQNRVSSSGNIYYNSFWMK